MADNTPKFVRLPERLVTGSMADLNSGWFIGGNDVKPVPDPVKNPVAHAFVRDRLRQGHLEPASEAEHKLILESTQAMADAHLGQLDEHADHDRYGHQEAALQAIGVDAREKLAKLRAASPAEDGYEEPATGTVMSTGGAQGVQDDVATPTGSRRRQ